MMDVMKHRGPDEEGMYIDQRIGIGHKRLSIIDLKTGRQPMSNEDGTVWLVYNGEIYNYKALRSYLIGRGHDLKTDSDTEVIVHLYEEYGEGLLSKLRGMFSFALWDKKENILLLARDRVGIKPLYYHLSNDSLVFASEIKAILEDPSVRREVNLSGIDRFLTFLYMPGKETLLRNVYKLSPGHYMVVKDGKVEVKQYWDLNFEESPVGNNLKGSVTELTELLRETVQAHMISDVPVGFLLSGGVDSTALLCFAIEETNKDIYTFTIGFEGEHFADERYYARLAANRFGTRHYEMTITGRDFWGFLPKYVWHIEEPVCEPPAIALYYVSKLAKEHVKVLISGEGGDEAFAGYQNYRNMVWLERLKTVFNPFNDSVSKLFLSLSRLGITKKFERYAALMAIPLEEYYFSRTSTPFSFFNKNRNELYSSELKNKVDKDFSLEPVKTSFSRVVKQNNLNKMLYVDTKTWLPDDLLVKADKMTLVNSLELRVPLLDHKVLEFAAGLPTNYKLGGFTTKYILKKAFSNKVPKEILYRRKTGFPVPYESWFRNDLKNNISDILMDKRTLQRGYFKKKAIENLIKQNSTQVDYSREIFSLLVLELWHRIFIENNGIVLV
jgi:asparagine synthase (glutamine-hydrolysing)